jgi:hypothetical protein
VLKIRPAMSSVRVLTSRSEVPTNGSDVVTDLVTRQYVTYISVTHANVIALRSIVQ